MTAEQREESGYRYLAALDRLESLESGRSAASGFDPVMCCALIMSLMWHGLEWERGLRP